MAKCDEGYQCSVCGKDVPDITASDLYLRYVTGLIIPEVLHTTSERHIHCNPILGQFIVHHEFPPIIVDGDFDKNLMDSEARKKREELVTRGWLRLRELRDRLRKEAIAITDYPVVTPTPDE